MSALCLSPDGLHLLTMGGADAQQVKLWDAYCWTHKLVSYQHQRNFRPLAEKPPSVQAAASASGSSRGASQGASSDHQRRAPGPSADESFQAARPSAAAAAPPGARITAGRARQMAVSGDGRTAFVPVGGGGGAGGGEDEVRVFELVSGRQVNALRGGHDWASVGCCVLNDGTTELFSGGEDGRVVVWGVDHPG